MPSVSDWRRPFADKNWKWPILSEISGQNGLLKLQTAALMADGFHCILAIVECQPYFNAHRFINSKCSLEQKQNQSTKTLYLFYMLNYWQMQAGNWPKYFMGVVRNGLYFLQHFGRLSYAYRFQSETPMPLAGLPSRGHKKKSLMDYRQKFRVCFHIR